MRNRTESTEYPSQVFNADVIVALDKIQNITAPIDATLIQLNYVHGWIPKNSVIAVLESQTIAEWQSDYLATQARLDATVKALARLENLGKIGASSIEMIQDREAQVIEYRAHLQQLEQTLLMNGFQANRFAQLKKTGKLQPSEIQIRATHDVYLMELQATIGQTLEAFQPVLTLANIDPITVHVNVPVNQARLLKIEQTATIQYADQSLTAEINHIDTHVNEMTQTIDVHLHLPNPKNKPLLPGEKVQVQFNQPVESMTYRLPKGALAQMDGANIVFQSTQQGISPLTINVIAIRGDSLYFSPSSSEPMGNIITHGTSALKLALSE